MEENNPNKEEFKEEKKKYELDSFGILSIIVMIVSTLIGLYFLFMNN